jgi:hypothetical protein
MVVLDVGCLRGHFNFIGHWDDFLVPKSGRKKVATLRKGELPLFLKFN